MTRLTLPVPTHDCSVPTVRMKSSRKKLCNSPLKSHEVPRVHPDRFVFRRNLNENKTFQLNSVDPKVNARLDNNKRLQEYVATHINKASPQWRFYVGAQPSPQIFSGQFRPNFSYYRFSQPKDHL